MNKIISKRNFRNVDGKIILSPLSLLVLAACSGGSGGKIGEDDGDYDRGGNLNKGPLKDALVFLDYEPNDTLDPGEPFVRSGADGSFSITGSSLYPNARTVAITDESTIDTSSGTVLAGVTLSAPATASVVSLASTLIDKSNGTITEAQLQEILGFDPSDNIDLLNFNPFAVENEGTLARDLEVASQQLGAVLTSVTASATAAGLSSADAFTESLSAIVTVVTNKTDSDGNVTGQVSLTDISQNGDLDAIADAVALKIAEKQVSDASIDAAAFTNMQTSIISGIANVNTEIDSSITTANFKSAEAAKIYSVTQVLADQATAAVTANKADKNTGNDLLSFQTLSNVIAAKTNAAPSDVDLVVDNVTLDEDARLTVSEAISNLNIATLSVTDEVIDSITGSATATIVEGRVYTVSENSVSYNSVTYTSGQSFTGVSGVTTASNAVTNGSANASISSNETSVGSNTFTYALAGEDASSKQTIAGSGTATVAEGLVYTVSENSVAYNGATYASGQSFTGVSGVTTASNAVTSGSANASISTNLFSISSDGVLSFVSAPDYESKTSYSIVIEATDAGGKGFSESFTVAITDVDEAFFAARGQIATDGSIDAIFTDYVEGTAGTFNAPANVDLTFSNGVVDFGQLEMDLVNINQGLSGGTSFVDPKLDIALAKIPTISGTTKTETVKIVVVDGADSERATGERQFEISFDVLMASPVGGNFSLTPQNTATINYYGADDTSPTTAVVPLSSNDALAYNATSGELSVKFLSVVNQATAYIPTSVLGGGGTFHATLTGLPLMNEDGSEITSLSGKINISDRDHTPFISSGAGTAAGTEDGSSVSGKLTAADAEGDVITYSVQNVTASSGQTIATGLYGTLTVQESSGTYEYVIDNSNATVNALKGDEATLLSDVFTVTASDGKTLGADTLTFTIQGVNDPVTSLSIDSTSVAENNAGKVVGILSATDPEGDPLTYSLVGSSDFFEVTSNLGRPVLKVKDGLSLNHEATSSYSVSIKASDGVTANDVTNTFTISVTDVNEAPDVSQPPSVAITEGVTETVSGVLVAQEYDDGQSLSYGIKNNDAVVSSIQGQYGSLTVDAGNGSYSYTLDTSLAATAALSAADQVSETFVVVVSDNHTAPLTAEKNLTINITGTDIGAAVKGPLHNAIVFNDYSGDGKLTDGEPFVRTNIDGSYTLLPTSGLNQNTTYNETGFNKSDYSIVVAMDNDTKDHTSGESYGSAGVTMKAAPGGSVVTPMTTLHEHAQQHSSEHAGTSFTPADLAAVLLPTSIGTTDTSSINILTFNTHADGVDVELAHTIENIQQHLMTTIQMVQAAIKGAGTQASGSTITNEVAHDVAQDALIKLIIHTHVGSNSVSGDLDLTLPDHLQELESLIEADLASGEFKTTLENLGVSVPSQVLEYVLDHSSTSIKAMNLEIDKLGSSDFGGVDAGAVSHLKHDMAEEILTMATAARAYFDSNSNTLSGFDGDIYLTLTSQSAIDAKILQNRTEVLTHLQTASPIPNFKISTDSTSAGDAVFIDYINGLTSSSNTTNIDLVSSSGVLSFGTVTVDSNNLAKATAGGTGYLSPTLTLSLDQLPRIAGSQDYSITVQVTEGTDAVKASGERAATISFSLSLSGDGETASLTAAAGGLATISYFGGQSTSASTLSIANADADVISFTPGSNGVPPTLNLKTLEILNKVSALNPTAILGDGATAHVKITGLPLADENSVINSVEGNLVVKDLIAPQTTISRASYDSSTGALILQGTNFDQLDVAIGGDVKTYLDWTKFSWDINTDGTTTSDVALSAADISSALVTNSETLTITINSAKKAILEATSGYGGNGGDDAIDISAGFIRDKSLNVTSDGTAATDTASDVTIVNLSELVRVSTDSTTDFVLTDYIGGAVADVQNLSSSASSGVLSFGTASLDLYNVKNGASGSTNYKSPEISLNIDTAALISGSKVVPVTITIIDGNDVARGSTERRVDVDFSLNLTGDGTLSTFTSSVSQAATVSYYSAGSNTPQTLSVNNLAADTFSIATGSNGLPSSLSIKTLNLIDKISTLGPSSVLGEGGNYYITLSGLPLSDEISYISSIQGVLQIENKVPPFRLSTDTSSDITVTDFLDGSTSKVDYSDLTMSGNILNFSQVYFDLANAQKGAAGSSSFTSPSLSFVVDSVPNIAGSDTKPVTLTIIDGTDSSLAASERKVQVTFDVSYTADGSNAIATMASSSNATISYFGAGDSVPTNLSITNLDADTLSITTGANTGTSTLSVKALALIDKINVLAPSDVLSSGGDYHLTIEGLPIGNETTTATSIQGVITIKDRVPPSSTVDSVVYDSVAGTLTIIGTKFDTMDVANGTDVTSQLDFSKMSWDIEGDDNVSANATFTAADFSSIIVTSPTQLTFTLTSAAKTSLEGTVGFAASGLNGEAGASDTIDVAEGFISDVAGNTASTDAKLNAAITFSDITAPQLASFTTTSADGAYGVGLDVNVIATITEEVLKGSTFTATLDTGSATASKNEVTLTASQTGTVLTGTYTVPTGVTSADLAVSSFSVGAVKDIYGNSLTSITIPTGKNLSDSSNINIDTQPPTSTIASAVYDGTSGVITITGDNFNTLGVGNGIDVKEYLDWPKLKWDIDFGDTDSALSDFVFSSNDISSAIVTAKETLTITLTADAKNTLHAISGFAAEGDTSNPNDSIDVATGFIRDTALNPASSDTKDNAVLSYADTANPTISGFTSDKTDGAYGVGQTVTIKALVSEKVISSSQFQATLSTNDTVTLTADADGTTLSGDYIVSAGDNSSDLTISSFTVGTVSDIYGNSMSSNDLPSGNNLADAKNLVVDTTAPTTEILSVQYDPSNGQLTFTGRNFDTMNVASNGSVLAYLDFSKLNWDINADDGTDVEFTSADIASATYSSATTMTVTLSASKKLALESTVGFAAAGGADTIDVSAGFIRDHALNAGNSDATTSLNSNTGATIGYSDVTRPTITSFTSTSADGDYGVGKNINITANLSESVIAGSAVSATLAITSTSSQIVTLSASTAGNTLVGAYTVPSSVSTADLGITSFSLAQTITGSDTVSIENGVVYTVSGNSVSYNGTTYSAGQAFTGVSAATTAANQDTGGSANGVINTSVIDTYGNVMTSTDIPAGQNLSNNSAIVIDTVAPTSTIESAEYNGTTGILTLTGTNFDTLGVSNGQDVAAQLDWTKFSWDINSDDNTTSNVSFAYNATASLSDIATAIVTSATTLTIALTATKKAALESTAGFAGAAADGTIGSTDNSDNDTIDVTAGFIVDKAGNAATGDAISDAAISYSDTARPTVTSFTSSSENKSYGVNSTINITANMSETVLKGSTFDVTLDTASTVTLTASATGTMLVGTYTVPSNVATADLSVTSFTVGNVQDIYGNAMNTVEVPTGQNLSNNASIEIDTTAPTSTIASAEYNGSTGVITINGTNFDTLGVQNGGSIASLLDLTKFSWDINGDDGTTANVVFETADISSALLVSPTVMTLTLSNAKKVALEATAGFAASDNSAADSIDVGAGFLKDTAGNLAAGDNVSDASITYDDTARPTVTSFSSTTASGSYGLSASINITATMSENVIAGSKFTVTLNSASSATVILEAVSAGNTLTGTYTVPENITTTGLSVTSFELASGQFVKDVYGNEMTSTTIPAGQNLANNSTISIDTTAPNSTITSAEYDGSTGVLTLTGTNFDALGLANGSVVTSQLDLSKISWDINGDNETTADVSLSADDISSAVLTNSTTLTLTLTSTKKAALASTTGFGASGGVDTIDVSAGFTKDNASNLSTTDAIANAAITYADATRPSINSFSTTSANNSYKSGDSINITATASEDVLTGGQITVTLGTTDEIILEAASTGTSLSGTYIVSDGDTSADLSISSFTLGSGSNVLQDIYGNEANSTSIPSGQNISDNAAIVIDTTPPSTTVSSVKYNSSTGEMVITGENFDSLNVANGTDVKSYLDWTKLSWDIDGDNDTTANASFNVNDITSAIVTNAQTLTITLTSSAKTSLEGTANFAASGSADKIDVTAGFIKDVAGNAATSDAKADAALTYNDTTAPKVQSFTSSSSDGSYKSGAALNITANMTETVLSGSTFVATLNTTDTVNLTAAANGTTLVGTYNVPAGKSSIDLGVTSFTTGSVTDVYGNTMANTTPPTGQNLSNNSDLVIDNTPIFANGNANLVQVDSGNNTADAGDRVSFNFSEAVANTSAVSAQFTGSTTYGASGSPASASWSNSNQTLTITLGVGETYGSDDISISDLLDSAGNQTSTLTFDVV